MATVRLIVVLLGLGLVVLLGVQNLATALPLVFLGGRTLALPLGVWLVSAIALGAVTTLITTALLGAIGARSGPRSSAYKYRPQSFYEPTEPASNASASASSYPRNSPPYAEPGPGVNRGNGSAEEDASWRDWTNLKSPGQWSDWESLSRAPKPETAAGPAGTAAASGLVDSVTTWFSSSKQQAKQQQRVNESLQALDDDWGDMEHRPYRAPGVSPVQDSLDDISQGWETNDPSRDFEASQAPRRVYRDGSIYSYSYRNEDNPSPGSEGQVDNIYAPPDDTVYGDGYNDSPDGEDSDHNPLGEPELAEDGVVDADYRVIVPPYTPAAEAAATSETWADNSNAEDDDWEDADDALTP
ncbi:hypothetical protein [Nodosilinea sp. E11]|uniref:hypothetical protein n=1 Tax=Nodosilinea sp. E11 TaxID=3037479 RepID=UPI002934CEEA|nr:hypothetical protein [Nodosilinea sp. E11]WOD40973.1 hypothetical protein RRF56_09225 [Nodosilinea sp. E11]